MENGIEEIFFKYLMQYRFHESELDYSRVEKHASVL